MMAYAIAMKARTIPWKLVEALLDEARRDRQWLQNELQVESNNVTNWKTRGVPNDYAPALSRLLKVNTDYLLGVPGAGKSLEEGAQPPLPIADQSALFAELILLTGKCDPDQQKLILKFAETQAKLAGHIVGGRRNKK